MTIYYLANKNAQNSGDHEVHRSDCSYLPKQHNQKKLGEFSSCAPAVAEAKKIYPTADGCYHCSPTCHTR